nr:transglutaminase-like domain-containing protein [uncultured Methanobacterium sp.]
MQAADTATINTDEPFDFELNPQVQIIGEHRSFGGFITKDRETDEGYAYDCMDWTRLLHGKLYRAFHNYTSSEIIIELLNHRGLNTGGITATAKKHNEVVFHNKKVVDVCHQLANLETDMEFFVNSDNVAILRTIPKLTEGYVFYPPSFIDLQLSQDSSNIITAVSAFGEDDRFLAQVKDDALIGKYGFIEDIISDTSLKTEAEGLAKAKELFNSGSKIEFSGSITTPLLDKMAAGQWIIIIPPSWSKYGIKSYYTQNVRTTINTDTEEQQIDLLNGQPSPPSEWIYESPGQTQGTFTNNYTLPSEIILSISDPVAAKARELGNPRAIRRWIDANIQYEFYYDFKYTPLQVLTVRKGNCYDQSLLFVQMCEAIGYSAYRRCGQICNGYAHCDALVYIDGSWIQVDVTCASRNQLE